MKTLAQTFLIAAARTRSVLDQIFFHSPIKLVETGSHRLKLDETWKKQIRYLTLNKVKEVETIERKMSMIY